MASTVSPFPSRFAPDDESAAPQSTPASNVQAPALAGSLEQMPLPDLLQTASSNGRTGRIDLEGGADADSRESGRIWMREGRVVDAALRTGSGEEVAGRPALYALLGWSQGRFALASVDVDLPDRIQDSTSFLLLDAMRQIDEERRDASPEHAGLPEEPPVPSRAQQSAHLSLLLLNVTSTWISSQLRPELIVSRFDEVRDLLRQGHPLLDRFEFDRDSALAGLPNGRFDDEDVDRLVKSIGFWLRGFYTRTERSLPGRFSLQRLAELTGAHAEQLTELGFHTALGWSDQWPEDENSTELAVTPDAS